jgi:hypothetical protein
MNISARVHAATERALRFTGKMGVIASEEEDDPVDVLEDEGIGTYRDFDALMDETGKYTAVFDPLDGSSNVDAGIPTGTIFGIFEDSAECIIPEEACVEESFADPPPDDCDVSVASQQCLAATVLDRRSNGAGGLSLTLLIFMSRVCTSPRAAAAGHVSRGVGLLPLLVFYFLLPHTRRGRSDLHPRHADRRVCARRAFDRSSAAQCLPPPRCLAAHGVVWLGRRGFAAHRRCSRTPTCRSPRVAPSTR